MKAKQSDQLRESIDRALMHHLGNTRWTVVEDIDGSARQLRYVIETGVGIQQFTLREAECFAIGLAEMSRILRPTGASS